MKIVVRIGNDEFSFGSHYDAVRFLLEHETAEVPPCPGCGVRHMLDMWGGAAYCTDCGHTDNLTTYLTLYGIDI